MYDELLDDPKVQRLPAEDFRGWVNLLCLASRNDGKLPSLTDISFALRETLDTVSTLVERLRSAGLIERRSGGADGAYDAPYRWKERQYKSDTSTGRVKRFRERSKTVAETPPETETEADISEAKASSVVDAEKRQAIARCLRTAWPCPEGVQPDHWRDFRRNRKTKRLTDSETAYEGQLRALAALSDDEWPPGRLVQYAAEKGWGSICDPRNNRNERSDQNPTATAVARVQAALRGGGGYG
jgi:predicted transcriptional regulator